MSKNILVLGQGFISNHLNYTKCSHRIIPDQNDIRALYDKYKPDVVINTIGRTGSPNIDACLNDKSNVVLTNSVLPVMLADVARDSGIHFVHVSSGCIYSGRSPNFKFNLIGSRVDCGWTEADAANPVSFYSRTKASADLAIQDFENVSIIRLRMPISDQVSPRNLLSKITHYSKVIEEPNSVTFLNDLTNAIDWIIEKEKVGIYNVASPASLTHSIFLEEYKKYFPNHKYEKINKEELDTMTASRRSNCILNVKKIQREGFEFQDTMKNVEEYVKNYCRNIKNV